MVLRHLLSDKDNDAKNANDAASSDTAPSALQFIGRFPLHWDSCTMHQILSARAQETSSSTTSWRSSQNEIEGPFDVVVLGSGDGESCAVWFWFSTGHSSTCSGTGLNSQIGDGAWTNTRDFQKRPTTQARARNRHTHNALPIEATAPSVLAGPRESRAL